LQIGDEEILIFVNMAVLIWLQYRKFDGLPELTRDGDYLIATSDDRRHFDQFQNQPFYLRGPIIATPLLLKYMKAKRIPIVCEEAYGQTFVMSMPTTNFAFDHLVQWARWELSGNAQGMLNFKRYLVMYI